MPNFDKLAATSEASGFEYYDIQDFNFTKPGGVFLPHFTGTTNQTSQTFQLPLNRVDKNLNGQVMFNVMVHVDKNGFDVTYAPGQYRFLHGSISDSVQVGTAGGFPIFYAYTLNVWNDPTNLFFKLNVANPSGVNDVTTQSITFDGTVYFYLAPF